GVLDVGADRVRSSDGRSIAELPLGVAAPAPEAGGGEGAGVIATRRESGGDAGDADDGGGGGRGGRRTAPSELPLGVAAPAPDLVVVPLGLRQGVEAPGGRADAEEAVLHEGARFPPEAFRQAHRL